MLTRLKTSLAASLMLAGMGVAHAQSAGDTVVGAGWLHIAPLDSSRTVQVTAFGATSEVPGSGASVGSADTAAFTVAHFFTDHVAGKAVFGIPPRFNIDATGTLAPLGRIGSVREWSPTLLLQYYLNPAQSRFRPYAGVGVSYVWFNGGQLSPAAGSGSFLYSPRLGAALTGPTSIHFENSLAPVFNAGATYNIDKHWSVDVSLSYMLLSTKVKLTTQSSVGPVETQTRLRLNPLISFVSLAYRF